MGDELREKVEVELERSYGTEADYDKPWFVHRRDCADRILALVSADRAALVEALREARIVLFGAGFSDDEEAGIIPLIDAALAPALPEPPKEAGI